MKKLSLAGALYVLAAMLVIMPASSLAQAAQHDHGQQAAARREGMKMGEMKMTP